MDTAQPNRVSAAELKQQVADALRAGLLARGIGSLSDLRTTNRSSKSRLDDGTLARYWKGGIPTDNRDSSRENMRRIARLTDRPEEILRLWEILLESAHRERYQASSAPQASSTSTWFGVIPRQATRDYASIDRITVHHLEDGRLSATMLRVYPERDRGLRWTCTGAFQGREAAFLVFNPDDPHNAASVGAVALLRDRSSYRPVSYLGQYTRMDDDAAALVTRAYEWHERLPSLYIPYVAVLDLDNTLQGGWALVSWLKSPSLRRLAGVDALRERVLVLRDAYLNGSVTHDDFARDSAAAYAYFASAIDPTHLRQAASHYVAQVGDAELFPYSRSLVDRLRAHMIAPLILTGARRNWPWRSRHD